MKESYWGKERFIDTIETAILAQYEKNIEKDNLGLPKPITPDLLSIKKLLKSTPPYCPNGERIIQVEQSSDYPKVILDTANDIIPNKGCFFQLSKDLKSGNSIFKDAYVHFYCFERINHLPQGFVFPFFKCDRFLVTAIAARTNHPMYVKKWFVAIDRDGFTHAAKMTSREFSALSKQEIKEYEFSTAVAFSYLADARCCWNITATELGGASVRLGCDAEEIKTLLYARTLPLSVTGRKRPILHVVSAHTRRLNSGIDININQYLRGLNKVIIGDTQFVITPPHYLETTK